MWIVGDWLVPWLTVIHQELLLITQKCTKGGRAFRKLLPTKRYRRLPPSNARKHPITTTIYDPESGTVTSSRNHIGIDPSGSIYIGPRQLAFTS